ncbi:VirB4 family type IV secretion system protein [Kroppenstedtia eburnea]|uniref:VirB4 family type IV secretion system protein n=1 Tax=Kroppenstedtia eburnea TaxID=714067 RepID=UPI0036433F90
MKIPFPSIWKKSELSLSQRIPVKDIGEEALETTQGTWKRVLRVSDPINTDLLSERDTLESIDGLQGAWNALKPGETLQMLLSSDKVNMEEYFSKLEEKKREAMREGDMERTEKIQSKIGYLQEHAHKSRNVHNFYVVLESQKKKPGLAVEELEDLTAQVLEKFREGDMQARPMKQKEVERVLHDKLAPTTSRTQPYDPDMGLLDWRPPDIKDRGQHLEMDGMLYKFYTISYIRRKVKPGWLKKVMSIRAALDISITIRSIDKGSLVDEVNTKILNLEEKLATKLPASFRKKYERQVASLEKMLDQIQDESENLFAVTFVLAVRADNMEDLTSAASSLESEVKASRMRAKKLIHKGQWLMWYQLPIGFNNQELERKISWPMPARTVASILPFNSSEMNYQEGILKGFNAQNESPIIYDRFRDEIFQNPNECVLGGSGSGKSFYIKVQMDREATEGRTNRIFAIDPEREYRFGNRAVLKIGSGYVINPFHIRSAVLDQDEDEELTAEDEIDLGSYLTFKMTEMISFFRWIYPRMDELEEALLLEAIEKVYAEKGYALNGQWEGVEFYEQNGQMRLRFHDPFPTLKDLDEILQGMNTMEKMRASLHPYTYGVYSSLFQGQTNWTMDEKINVFDISELSESVQRPVYDLLLKDIWEEIKIDRSEYKGFVVDEAWLLCDEKNQQAMEFLRRIAKRIRKYNGYLTVATQNIDDFLSVGKYGGAILKNSYIKTFFRMDDKDIDELTRFMRFSSKELKVMSKPRGRGHGIHICGSKRIEFKTDASPDEFQWLPLTKEKKELVKS